MMTNKMQLFWLIYLFLISYTHFERCLRPSSGALDCIYSIWYCSPVLLPAGVMDDGSILAYLFIPNQLYMFRTMSSPIIWSTWLYLQHLILFTEIAAGWCHGWDGTAVPSHPWHQPAAIPVDNIRSCKYSQVFLMKGGNIAETCRAD